MDTGNALAQLALGAVYAAIAYLPLPLLFGPVTKPRIKPVTYVISCYLMNAVIVVVLSMIRGVPSGGGYILWTAIGCAIGKKGLTPKPPKAEEAAPPAPVEVDKEAEPEAVPVEAAVEEPKAPEAAPAPAAVTEPPREKGKVSLVWLILSNAVLAIIIVVMGTYLSAAPTQEEMETKYSAGWQAGYDAATEDFREEIPKEILSDNYLDLIINTGYIDAFDTTDASYIKILDDYFIYNTATREAAKNAWIYFADMSEALMTALADTIVND